MLFYSYFINLLAENICEKMALMEVSYTVLKVTCESGSISDLLNKNSEFAASQFFNLDSEVLGRKHRSFSGRAKFENYWAAHEYMYNQ